MVVAFSDLTSRLGATGTAAALRAKRLGKGRRRPSVNPILSRACHTQIRTEKHRRDLAMMRVIADVNVTRRQRIHHVFNDQDEPRFSASKFGDVLNWLFENGETEYLVHTEENAFKVRMERSAG